MAGPCHRRKSKYRTVVRQTRGSTAVHLFPVTLHLPDQLPAIAQGLSDRPRRTMPSRRRPAAATPPSTEWSVAVERRPARRRRRPPRRTEARSTRRGRRAHTAHVMRRRTHLGEEMDLVASRRTPLHRQA